MPTTVSLIITTVWPAAVPELHNADLPSWLVAIAWISLILGVGSFFFILSDVIRRPQPMKVMNVVWPIDGLWGSVAWVAAYLWWGRAPRKSGGGQSGGGQSSGGSEGVAASAQAKLHAAKRTGLPIARVANGAKSDENMSGMSMDMAGMSMDTSGTGMGASGMGAGKMSGMKMHPALGLSGKAHSMPVSVFIGTSHCGAGCSTADLIVEWTLFLAPGIAVAGGLGWIFSNGLFAGWVISYFVALAIGIGFQYAAIAPMNPGRGVWSNVWDAAKADVLSLSAWQIGMYGGMAIGQLWIFPATMGAPVATDTPVFWFMMQIAMLMGFMTAYPVNWFLISKGIKERM